ncbi:lipoyl domain-containing protein [Actinoplanes sp. NBC_00393]|uniref:lipoyl domain-containing protein n=1 Tax=Actinoplanes sp. NBC_00393 TaxID=2975953 RepID=UPI002E1CC783
MTEVLFPALSKEDPAALGVLTTWFVTDGDQVTADQLLAEVQVDKVSVEVPSPITGVIHLLVDEEAEVRQGSPIATIAGG